MAEIKPFRAVRYDEREAGSLESLVAPPYDVITPVERERYLARSPYNIVRLTLPDDEEQAARDYRDWLDRGVLARDDEPRLWWLEQDFTGPDGVGRTRAGLVASLRVEPYERGVVLPHERTHAGPKEGRLRLLRATRTHLEPIFLLWYGAFELDGAEGDPLLDVTESGVRSRLRPLPEQTVRAFVERLRGERLLIADGHHRYETALAFHADEGSDESAWMLVVIVPQRQPGLAIFPTHRVAERLGTVDGGRPAADVHDALASVAALPRERPAVAVYRGGEAFVVTGDEPELDVAFVETLRPQGVTYTASVEEAVAAVDNGQAEAAVLLRPPLLEQVRAVAERGETMPQKSTYFYPKLTSGLLLHPL